MLIKTSNKQFFILQYLLDFFPFFPLFPFKNIDILAGIQAFLEKYYKILFLQELLACFFFIQGKYVGR